MSDSASSSISLAMVMVAQPQIASADSFRQALQTAFPKAPVVDTPSDKSGIYSFKLGRHTVFIALMPGPIPWTDLESLTQAAWQWPEAKTLLPNHKAHILVTVMDAPLDPIDANLLLTRITRTVLKTQAALGVYWAGPAISSSEMFLSASKGASRQNLPILLWVSFNLVREGKNHTIITQGMEKFGHREMETLGDTQTEGSLEFALDLAIYVLKNGPILQHGHTFGRSASEKFKIVHRPYSWDKSKTAIVLNMRPEGDAPKGFFNRLLGR